MIGYPKKVDNLKIFEVIPFVSYLCVTPFTMPKIYRITIDIGIIEATV